MGMFLLNRSVSVGLRSLQGAFSGGRSQALFSQPRKGSLDNPRFADNRVYFVYMYSVGTKKLAAQSYDRMASCSASLKAPTFTMCSHSSPTKEQQNNAHISQGKGLLEVIYMVWLTAAMLRVTCNTGSF